MKKIYLFSKACMFAAMMFVASSCSEEETIVTPIFPEGETVETVVPGTEYTLSFTANMDWELKSSALWCLFSNNGMSIKGEAGEVSQKITITRDAWTLEAATANITLLMGEEEKVIATYTRQGLVPTVTDSQGEVYSKENPCVFAFSQDEVRSAFAFTANFDWVLDEETDIPDWCQLEGEIKGASAGEEVYIAFSVPEDRWMGSLEGEIVIKNTEIEGCVFKVPVRYDGFPEGELMISGVEGSAYWWAIAADGKSFWRKSSSVSGGTTEGDAIEFPFSFNVIAKDNAYKVVHVEQDDWGLSVIEDQYMSSFITINNENGNITIESVSANTGSERCAYILVMPTDVYEDMMEKVTAGGGLYDNILFTPEGDGISTGSESSPNYDSYTVFAFKQQSQQATEVGEFVVKNALTDETIECEKGDNTGNNIDQYLASDFSVPEDKIYSISVSKNASISIDPLLSMDEWMSNGDISTAVVAQTLLFADVDKTKWGISLNASETAFIISSLPVTETFYIVFKGSDGVNKKALIINVQ